VQVDDNKRTRDGSVIAFDGKAWREWSWPDRNTCPYCCDTAKAVHSIVFDGTSVYSTSTDSGLRMFEKRGWRKVLSTDSPPPEPALCTIWSAPGLPMFAGTMKGLERWSDAPAMKPAMRADARFESVPSALWASAQDDVWLSTIPCTELAVPSGRERLTSTVKTGRACLQTSGRICMVSQRVGLAILGRLVTKERFSTGTANPGTRWIPALGRIYSESPDVDLVPSGSSAEPARFSGMGPIGVVFVHERWKLSWWSEG
jgi:hypothetical protein